MLTPELISEARTRIAPYVHRTPVLSSRAFNAATTVAGREVFFKCENFQRAGAFKMRGATNKIRALGAAERERLAEEFPDALLVSARTGDGIDRLRQRMSEMVIPTEKTVDVTIPYDRGDLVDRAHREGEILQIEHIPEGTRINLRAPASLSHALAPYDLAPASTGDGDGSVPGRDGDGSAPEHTGVPASQDG